MISKIIWSWCFIYIYKWENGVCIDIVKSCLYCHTINLKLNYHDNFINFYNKYFKNHINHTTNCLLIDNQICLY